MHVRLKTILRRTRPLLIGLTTLAYSACEKAEPVTYRIPKEKAPANAPAMPPATESPSAGNMQVLPGMTQASQDTGSIRYTLPKGWEEFPASGIRKANFKVSDETGTAEVTVLTFPGDVGGTLANINRWRGQIGLAAVQAEDIDSLCEAYSISEHPGLFVRLEGETQSIVGALLPLHGHTWFFKMLGTSPTVLAQETEMKQFLDSVQLEDPAH